jgi:hypothetical protein
MLLSAAIHVVCFRLALWIVPSPILLRFVARRVEKVAPRAASATSDVPRIAWAVNAIGRRLPGSTCLVEALAARLLLARHRHRSTLGIGVGRDANQKFVAHAWVEVDGRIVVGGRSDRRYSSLPQLGSILHQ